MLPYFLAGLSLLNPSSIQPGNNGKRTQKHLFLMAASEVITAAFEKLLKEGNSLERQRAEQVGKGQLGTFSLLCLLFLPSLLPFFLTHPPHFSLIEY